MRTFDSVFSRIESFSLSDQPHISFLLPVFNMADTLPETLESLFKIREFSFELIVIDDGSTDSTAKIIKQWKDHASGSANIVFRSIFQQNKGRAHALNEGAKMAEGEYLSFIDADDVIDPDELLKLWQCMQSAKTDLILGQFRIATETGKIISSRSLDKEVTGDQLIQKLAFLPISPVHLNAFLMKRTYFLTMNGLDKTNLKSEDKDLLIRLLRGTESLKVCDAFHYIYRKHNLSRLELFRKRFEWFFYRQKMIQKNFSGVTKIGSMCTQGFYDLVKLFYEVLFKYRL